MDQACAFGPGRLTLLTFDGETVDVKPLQKVGGDGVHVVVADLGAGKDTVRILDDLQRAYPTPRSDADRELHALLGENNSAVVDAAIVAIESGDAPGLGFVYQMAQRGFDEIAGVACPSRLGERGSPKLHEVLRCEKLKRAACGGKGVGSQGDGSVQFVCDGATRAAEVRAILKEEFGLADAMTIVIPPSTSA